MISSCFAAAPFKTRSCQGLRLAAGLVNRAARGAAGLAFVFAVIALAFVWAAYRLASWPLRRIARDNPATAKRQAILAVVSSIAVAAAVLRSTADDEPDEPDDEPDEPDDEPGGDERNYTPASWVTR
jgi:type II secretory pathway component PulM